MKSMYRRIYGAMSGKQRWDRASDGEVGVAPDARAMWVGRS